MLKWYKNHDDYWKRIYKLEIAILQTNECKNLDKKMDIVSNEIKQYLPEDKQYLVSKIEDCFIEGLILYEEHFYKSGYMDNNIESKIRGFFEDLVSWIRN